MMRMDFDLALESLYAFYGLTPPDDSVADGFYDMLKKLPVEAVHYAVQEYRETHERISRGDNVALALKKYAEKWRNPNRKPTARILTGCPDGCQGGLFYVRVPGSVGPYAVVPCATCQPEMSGARSRSTIENAGQTILGLQQVICNDFYTQPSVTIADPPL